MNHFLIIAYNTIFNKHNLNTLGYIGIMIFIRILCHIISRNAIYKELIYYFQEIIYFPFIQKLKSIHPCLYCLQSCKLIINKYCFCCFFCGCCSKNDEKRIFLNSSNIWFKLFCDNHSIYFIYNW